jgi:uncharacterized spore protein YtfJ
MTIDSAQEQRLLETLRGASDGAAVGRTFGAPIVHDGALLLPVARVGSGVGGGGGSLSEDEGRRQRGTGGGFGTAAEPLGVFVFKDGEVTWRPVVDVNRVLIAGQVVAVAALLVVRAILKARRQVG